MKLAPIEAAPPTLVSLPPAAAPPIRAMAVSRAIEAKRRGEIDDFVFYDVSLDYLAASLQSL